MTVFEGEEKPPPLFATAIGTGKNVIDRYENFTSPEAVHAYFQMLLNLRGEQAQDVQQILPLIRSEFVPFRTVAERFHLIDTATKIGRAHV